MKAIIVDIESIPSEIASLAKRPPTDEDEFPAPIFHKVACIGYIVLNDVCKIEKAGVLGLDMHSEKEALRLFGEMIDDKTMVITWNGRRFDMAVISYRSMKYGIQTPWDFSKEFRGRFKLQGHIDLQDWITNHGASDRVPLDVLCVLLGLPGKITGSGSSVHNQWVRKQFVEIGAYCITDVIQTAVCFIRFAHLMGKLTTEEHNEAILSLQKYGQSVKETSDPSRGYLDHEADSVAHGFSRILGCCDWSNLVVAP
jgi:predicted PolB exonuclease-like 3'-5' exonuclease